MSGQFFHAPHHEVVDAVTRALREDLSPLGDVTSSLIDPAITATAQINSRKPGRLAGSACVRETFRQVDPTIEITWYLDDGDAVEAGSVIADVHGPLATILVGERTALNFLGHLSGIATLVNKFVVAADGRIGIWDTRKTTPGLRSLEKAATRAGGGRNHRGNLSGWLMFKDNHLVGTTIADAVATARDKWPGCPVHVECARLDQVEQAMAVHADLILLDNMTSDQVRSAMAIVGPKRVDGRPIVEASGGITIDTIAEYTTTGVDFVSSGSLTNSAPVLDIGLDIEVDAVQR